MISEFQQNLFDPSKNGEFEEKRKKELKNEERNRRNKETRLRKKKEKEIMNLRNFEKEHPESFLFPEYKIS